MESKPATSATSAQLAEVFNSAFSDYVGGSVDFDAESLETWFSKNFVSRSRSRVVFSSSNPDQLAAYCFISVKDANPYESRIPIMGVAPFARGTGTGSRLLDDVIKAEKSLGATTIELECIKDNPLALNMYKRRNFMSLRELWGWERDAPVPGEFSNEPELQDCTIEEVDALVKKHGAKDLPWQAMEFYKRLGPNMRAVRLGPAYCVVTDPSDPDADTVTLHSFIVDPAERNQGHARKMIRAMLGTFPGKKWEVPGIFPREYGDNMAKELGFRESEGNQFQMRLSLN